MYALYTMNALYTEVLPNLFRQKKGFRIFALKRNPSAAPDGTPGRPHCLLRRLATSPTRDRSSVMILMLHEQSWSIYHGIQLRPRARRGIRGPSCDQSSLPRNLLRRPLVKAQRSEGCSRLLLGSRLSPNQRRVLAGTRLEAAPKAGPLHDHQSLHLAHQLQSDESQGPDWTYDRGPNGPRD